MFLIRRERLLWGFAFGCFWWVFFVLFPQDIMYYLVKNKTNCGALSNSYTATLPGDGSPGWVARNLCATEC